MQEIIQTIILGIIQGLTEFLPVSSSGHLEILKELFGSEISAEDSLLTTVILHFATAISTVIVFRRDILEIIQGLFNKADNTYRLFAWYIVLSMIPAALVGIFMEDQIEMMFSGNLVWVGGALLVTALLLYISDQMVDTSRVVKSWSALIIGIAQAIAIVPGISRSGATIAISLFLGIRRDKAARFSFLMVIPLIFGKIAKDLIDGSLSTNQAHILPLVIGFIAALVTGIIACRWMINWVKNSHLKYFAYYCFVIGLILIIITAIR